MVGRLFPSGAPVVDILAPKEHWVMEDPEKPKLPQCTCAECPDHLFNQCDKEAIVKARDGTLFCADCLIAIKIRAKHRSAVKQPSE
jgi:ferredoxin-like protein FixX